MSISSKATGLRPGVCTSTTRPSGPYTGQIIYETDTGYLRVWDGANWDYLSKSQDDTVGIGPVGGLVFVKSQTIGSAVSSVTVNSCFNATFDSYRIVMSDITMSNASYATQMQLQMTSGGTPSTTNVYAYGIARIDQGSGAYAGLFSAGTSAAVIGLGSGYSYATAFDCHMPYLAKVTGFTGLGAFHYYNGYAIAGGACHNVESSYDGFKIFASTGTLTGGTIFIYGYRKS